MSMKVLKAKVETKLTNIQCSDQDIEKDNQ